MGRRQGERKSRQAQGKLRFGLFVFDDPNFFKQPDDDPTEVRFKVTGFVGPRLITVIYTERSPRRRIISVRKASQHEQKAYFDQV